MKRMIVMLLALLLFMSIFFGCSDRGVDSIGSTNGTSNNAGEMMSSTESGKTDDSTESVEKYPEMDIGEGYSVVDSQILKIPVTENGVKLENTARVAVLRNTSGENALYFDVLSADNQILSYMRWRGYYQLYITDEGRLILMQIMSIPELQRGNAICTIYEISDIKIAGNDVIELDAPQINAVVQRGASCEFVFARPSDSIRYETVFLNFVFEFRDEFETEKSKGRDVRMLAECYFNVDSPVVYSEKQKVPVPDFNDKTVAGKYTWAYVYDLLT